MNYASRGDRAFIHLELCDVRKLTTIDQPLVLMHCRIPPMPNVASILKAEISRVARKEVRGETTSLKKAVITYRREIAALKRRTQALERLVRRESKSSANESHSAIRKQAVQEVRRFSAKGLRSQRKRLGLSAAEVGLILGATAQSVYNWEQGKARPSAKHMPAVIALRTLGKRAAEAVIASRKQNA